MTACKECGKDSLRRWVNQYAAGVSCPCGFNMPLISRKPIPPEDLERASRYVVEQGWVKSRAEGS